MKKTTQEIFYQIVRIPNIPVGIILGIFVAIMIYIKTDRTEWYTRVQTEGFRTPEIEKLLKRLYPDWLRHSIAALFYGGIYAYFITN